MTFGRADWTVGIQNQGKLSIRTSAFCGTTQIPSDEYESRRLLGNTLPIARNGFSTTTDTRAFILIFTDSQSGFGETLLSRARKLPQHRLGDIESIQILCAESIRNSERDMQENTGFRS